MSLVQTEACSMPDRPLPWRLNIRRQRFACELEELDTEKNLAWDSENNLYMRVDPFQVEETKISAVISQDRSPAKQFLDARVRLFADSSFEQKTKGFRNAVQRPLVGPCGSHSPSSIFRRHGKHLLSHL